METELKNAEATVAASLEEAGTLATLSSEDDSTAEIKAMLNKGVEVISNLDTILGNFCFKSSAADSLEGLSTTY